MSNPNPKRETIMSTPTISKIAAANLNLTDNETNVLASLIGQLYAEPGFSDVIVPEIASDIGMGGKACGGVVASLVKKGIVHVSEAEYWMGKVEIPAIVYLNASYWYLHPDSQWEIEAKDWGIRTIG